MEVLETLKVSSSFGDFFVLSDLCWRIEEEADGELQAAADATLFFMMVDIVELLADFSTPPDTNEVLDDEMEGWNCYGKCNSRFLTYTNKTTS